jgi:hypothetical protein
MWGGTRSPKNGPRDTVRDAKIRVLAKRGSCHATLNPTILRVTFFGMAKHSHCLYHILPTPLTAGIALDMLWDLPP